MNFLEINNIQKSFGDHVVVHNFDFAAHAGEFISLLGPSGCGKTTVLRMVAGFERQTAGTVSLDGKDISQLPPNQRNVGMVFQAYALFPNMTVAQNIAFGLKIAKRPAGEIARRVREMLDLIKLPALGDRYPFQLSGGQQQRVALARALAVKPKMLLLDEPLSALDAKIRVALREEIRSVQRELGITTLFVTHDQEEALSISDRIVVMSAGRVEQIGTPFEIYNRPRTRFVASFVGVLNLLEGRITDPASGRIEVDGRELVVAGGFPNGQAGDAATLALRPEAITIGAGGEGSNHLDGHIEDVGFQGSVVRIRVRCNDRMISLDSFNSRAAPPPERGSPVTLSFSHDVQVLEPA